MGNGGIAVAYCSHPFARNPKGWGTPVLLKKSRIGFLHGRTQRRSLPMSPVEMEREDDQKPDANEKLEQVFDTADETEALVVRGLLESNGIECMESTLDAPQDVLPGVGGIVLS